MNRKTEGDRADIYTRITNRIVADLERGVRPWMKPWNAANAEGRITRPLRHNGQPYSGMNVLLLWSEGMARGFTSPMWMTFKQALEFGAAVRKGETGSTVVFASRFTKSETDGSGNEVDREIPFLKAYSVFNVDQIDGLPDHHYHRPTRIAGSCSVTTHRLDVAQEVGDKIGVEIFDRQLRGRLSTARARIADQQPESVPVAGNGVGACFHLCAEPVSEEALNERREVGRLHCSPSAALVIRVEASSSNSGTASRYQ
ncbi:ArdC-like ssDNA-binding domain-containing protein [Rhizobium anhuiense]|uniref:ArdC-like ssDNA-binding domain-containing protein n=1 Tax=Rhizobium anhuiense TaxID=1184720 RepID=UPI001FE1B555|nr:ArdC-like ssDNA-binding domain-containing protein [Rhizobium anhuiense]